MLKRVREAISDYNKYHSPEATVEIIEIKLPIRRDLKDHIAKLAVYLITLIISYMS